MTLGRGDHSSDHEESGVGPSLVAGAGDRSPRRPLAIALAITAASAWVLARGGGHHHDLNTRGAFLHVVGDLLGSVGAIVAAVVMLATGWYLADPILSAGIGVLIVWSSYRLLRESVDVLLEATPAHLDATAVRTAMGGVAGVGGVHDLHIWTVTSGIVALSGHVVVGGAGGRSWDAVLDDLATLLRDRFGIVHVTLQPEAGLVGHASRHGCSLDSPEGLGACRVAAPNGHVYGHRGHGHAH
ncbi:MAG: cation diffusion facilitator family transporter [Chloroflexota bacterium]|nr:cation diffusion facilitator family transporter [Chloroflexota bacterium]